MLSIWSLVGFQFALLGVTLAASMTSAAMGWVGIAADVAVIAWSIKHQDQLIKA